MLVRVKETLVENFYGFYGDRRRYPGDKFELVARKGANSKTISAKSQFSEKWMEELVKPESEAPVVIDESDQE
jgi:hypothetical protein